ncbi:unnamed protein product [Psylliodes chrysocephalus]|uniref:Uncharacterized protein n=1 Tax=Psylliodes chrysocephalus TaxID=3402493 RepID=A0A9P0CS92_9CUCU|nr:unnamed protein product [Psylliodes chrysocephala]
MESLEPFNVDNVQETVLGNKAKEKIGGNVQSGITIFQKYLKNDHTQMEYDSTYALIKRKVKNREIHIPSHYSLAIKEARLKPFHLVVHYIPHDVFMKYDNKDLYTYQSIRPGRNVNDAKVTDIKTFKYFPDSKIFHKLSYDDEYYVELPCRSNTNNSSNQLRCQLYDNRIKITEKKFKDLQELTKVKDFYSSLLYQSEDKNQVNKKAKQKTELDKSVHNQKIAKLKKTSSKKKATNLKSTTKYKNKGNEKAKQKQNQMFWKRNKK